MTPSLDALPDSVVRRITTHLSPVDRIRLSSVNRRFSRLLSVWNDVAIEIRHDAFRESPRCLLDTIGGRRVSTENGPVARIGFPLPMVVAKAVKTTYHVCLTDSYGRVSRIRTTNDRTAPKVLKLLLNRLPYLQELTLWEACLSSDFASTVAKMDRIQVLRLWNCSRYFDKKIQNDKLIRSLFGLPRLHSLLILDSTPAGAPSSTCRASLSRSLVSAIRGPIENIQLTGMHVPLRSLETLVDLLGPTLQRLSFGCTFGKESKRLAYLRVLQSASHVNDLDLPPFIFHLGEMPVPDGVVQRLFESLPLRALGFRHYNSSVLFRFIEYQLPLKIKILRVYHNANRIPNFAQLGQEEPEPLPPPKKSSITSKYSILSASHSSIGSNENNNSSSTSTAPLATTTTTSASFAGQKQQSTLALRKLTIFSIEEAKRKNQRLRRRTYNTVEVIYTQESQNAQEILGRMAEPMRSPHVYSKSAKREMRVIKGDLVRPIPLASLGMESDYEDWDE